VKPKRTEEPRFSKGDKVVDFRGRRATVVRSIESRDWETKSHRVCVTWDDRPNNNDQTAYYEEVFDYATKH
jgi:hypothetical protein